MTSARFSFLLLFSQLFYSTLPAKGRVGERVGLRNGTWDFTTEGLIATGGPGTWDKMDAPGHQEVHPGYTMRGNTAQRSLSGDSRKKPASAVS